MDDFFSFEYFDELPSHHEEIGIQNRSSHRKNQSLNSASSEFLKEAMNHLVPSSYVYGETGIGNRAYELYGLCVSHAFTGRKGNLLIACMCVMHATYERRSDLVILPSDISVRFAEKNNPTLRPQNVLKYYDQMCRTLGLPRLEPSMEKTLERVFRQGCHIKDERKINILVQTAMKIAADLRKFTDRIPEFQAQYKRRLYNTIFRFETVAAAAATLTCRVHRYTSTTSVEISKELNSGKDCALHLIKRYKETMPGAIEDPEGDANPHEDPKARHLRRRKLPIHIAGIVVPPGMSMQFRDSLGTKTTGDQILRIVPRGPSDDDPLSFLGGSQSYTSYQMAVPALPEGLGYGPPEPDVPPLPTDTPPVEVKIDVPALPPPPIEFPRSPRGAPQKKQKTEVDFSDFFSLLDEPSNPEAEAPEPEEDGSTPTDDRASTPHDEGPFDEFD